MRTATSLSLSANPCGKFRLGLRFERVGATLSPAMYTALLIVHSWLRWAVLALAIVGLVRAVRGLSAKRAWDPTDERVGKWFLIAVDVQLLLGLALYAFFSPSTHTAFADFGAAMKDRVLRFWAVEHSFAMLLAVVAAHVGRVRGKKLGQVAARHRVALVTFAIFVVLVLAAFPWPGMPQGRALFRFSL
jgi:hypothetical protein